MYTKKMLQRLESPRNCGFFTPEEADQRQMRYVEGIAGSFSEGSCIKLSFFVDPIDGLVVDARFQAYGSIFLIAATDSLCDLSPGKNYLQMEKITPDQVERQLRDGTKEQIQTENLSESMVLILKAVHMAMLQCHDIPLDAPFELPTPIPNHDKSASTIPDWENLSIEHKLLVIEEVLNKEIRPYIEKDEGGVEVLNLINNELVIAYKGACTSCLSSVGATLSSIQEILRMHVHPELTVVPNLGELQFHTQAT